MSFYKTKTFWLLIITAAVYINTLWNSYSFDDNFVVNEKITKKRFDAIKEIFTTHYWQEKDNTFGYRPIVRSTFFIEKSIWGNNPTLSHLVNLLLYLLSILTLYHILKRLFVIDEKLIWWISLLFALHPIHTEVVASLKNREDIFAMLFGLLSLKYLMDYVDVKKISKLLLSLFSLFIAMLSKESGIIFLFLIPLSIFVWKKNNLKVIAKNYVVYLYIIIAIIGTFIILKLPHWILTPENKILFFFENPLHEKHTLFEKFLFSVETLGFYIKKLFFPFHLLYYYGYKMIQIPIGLTLNIIFFALSLGTSLWILFKTNFKIGFVLWSILWFWGAILPFSNWFIPINGIVAERLTYIASLGFISVLVYFIFNLKRKFVILTLIAIILSVLTFKRNFDWKNTETLLYADMPYLENSAKANVSFSTLLLNDVKNNTHSSKTIDTVIYHYKKAIEIYPEYYAAMNNLGLVYMVYLKNYNQAEKWLKEAINLKDNYAEANYNLARLRLAQKDTFFAKHFFIQAFQNDEKNIFIISDLANLYFAIGKKDSAIILNNKIAEIDTLSDIPYINMGNYALLSHDTNNAVMNWEKAIKKNQNNRSLIYGLSQFFSQHENKEKADYYNKLLY